MFRIYEKILCVSFFFKVIAADHFFGGSIIWKPLDQNLTGYIDIIFQFRFYWNYQVYRCNDNDILEKKIIGAGERAISISIKRQNFQMNSGVVCTDNGLYDDQYIWSGGQQSQIISLNQSIGQIEATFASCCWIRLVNGGGSWELRLKLDFTKRKDNNKINSSPIALMSPLTFLPLNFTSVIKVPTRDPDFDIVKCRWALSNLRECAGVCNSAPGALIDEENCTITFTPEKEGFYVMALQIEDFYNATDDLPLSSIPLQFMLYVENKTIDNDIDQIEFYYITPEDGSEFILEYNETFYGQIVINSSSRIVELMTLSPIGLWKSPIFTYNDTTDLWYVNFTWTHLETGQEGLNLFCFQAKNLKGASTELRCINLIGSITPRLFSRYILSTSYIGSFSTISTLIEENPFEKNKTKNGEKNKTENGKKNNWIIPLAISLGVLVLIAIFALVSFFLLKKCLRKKKIENRFSQSDLDNILSRDGSQITVNESIFEVSRPVSSTIESSEIEQNVNESIFDVSRPVSSTIESSEIDQNEHKNIIKKKKTPEKRFCIICGKTHITGFYFAKENSFNICSHRFPAYNIDPRNEVYLKKKKNIVKKIK